MEDARSTSKFSSSKYLYITMSFYCSPSSVPAVRNTSNNHTTTAPAVSSSSWLAEHLRKCGYDTAVVKDCEEKLVVNAGFMSETDFAVCPQSILNHEYLTSIGITKLGVQMNLLQLQLKLQSKQNSAPFAVSSTGTSVPHSIVSNGVGATNVGPICSIYRANNVSTFFPHPDETGCTTAPPSQAVAPGSVGAPLPVVSVSGSSTGAPRPGVSVAASSTGAPRPVVSVAASATGSPRPVVSAVSAAAGTTGSPRPVVSAVSAAAGTTATPRTVIMAGASMSFLESRQVVRAAATSNAAPRPSTGAPRQDISSDAAATGAHSRSAGSADIGTGSGSGTGAGVGAVVTDFPAGNIVSDAAPITAVAGSGRTHPAGSTSDLSSRKRDRAEGSSGESAPEPHIYVPPSSKKRK